MECLKNRKLNKNEVVHHIDEDKTNNNLNNLELMSRSEQAKLHGEINVDNRLRNKKGQLI